MSRLKTILTHPLLALALRLYMGGVFLYASMGKITYTGEFANTIASYSILPYWLVNFTAVVLPWIELICGILLLAGIRVKTAALSIIAMLAVFASAIGVNLLRGTPIGCGCFSSLEDAMSLMTLLRDLIWLGMTLHVFYYDRWFQLERKLLLSIKEVEP